MRLAAWGALSLGLFALTFGSPVREVLPLHGILSLGGIAGYLLLSFDPLYRDLRHRRFLVAGAVCALVSFVLVVSGSATNPVIVLLARVLAVATVALPLWLEDKAAQFAFVAAGAMAVVTALPGMNAGKVPTSLHAYLAALAACWVAYRLARPGAMPWSGERKPPRLVVASNIVTLTPQEKAARLARIEKRFRDGEIPEHKYWDLRQELDSR